MNHPKDLWRLMRPLQWIKNAFVLTGLIFGKHFGEKDLLLSVLLATIAFSLVSSFVYIINDITDIESDRHHPKKRLRPLPSERVSLSMAIILAMITCVCGLSLAYFVSWRLLEIVICYILLNIAYSLYLKHVVILDVFCIAGGFMLRILAGTIGVGIPASKWLLLCGLMITLFLGFAKRRAELIALKHNPEKHRYVLENYSPVLLEEILAICATSVIISYSLYTMSPETIEVHHTSNLIYTVPPVIYALFRYLFLLHHQQSGGDPTRDLFKDRHIIAAFIIWACCTVYLISRSA
jgi:4-hydroxybenzoate polyprenyltransferase